MWLPTQLRLCRQIMQLLTKGNRQRTQEPTAANRSSSRVHAVLQVTVRRRNRGADALEGVHVGRLFLVDLAGSERASQVLWRPPRPLSRPHSYSPPHSPPRAGPCPSSSNSLCGSQGSAEPPTE